LSLVFANFIVKLLLVSFIFLSHATLYSFLKRLVKLLLSCDDL